MAKNYTNVNKNKNMEDSSYSSYADKQNKNKNSPNKNSANKTSYDKNSSNKNGYDSTDRY